MRSLASRFLGVVFALGLAGALFGAAGCGRAHADCSNGTCVCDPGGDCSFACHAPPCHVKCDGDTDCDGVCSNGTCSCGPHSSCDFSCGAPPCHVTCAANSACHGECANGQCTCGPNSACNFNCISSPCHTRCGPGSRCVVQCPAGVAGTPGCDFVDCAAGGPVLCPDGITTTCGTDCPK